MTFRSARGPIVFLLALAGLSLGAPVSAQEIKLTREHFDKLKLGMSAKEVKDVLGKPSNEILVQGVGLLMYQNADASKLITAIFKDGKVVQRSCINLVDKDPEKLTKANVEKVKEGMTVKEVVAIMGPATTEVDPDPTTKEGAMGWTTVDRKKSLEIAFKDGKVTNAGHFGFDQ